MATRVNTTRTVEVVPLIRVTPSLALLSYRVPAGLRVFRGAQVRIPFRTKVLDGIVWGESEVARKSLKEILQVEIRFSLTETQTALADWLHARTLTPLNVVLRSMLTASYPQAQPGNKPSPPKKTVVVCPTETARQEILARWAQQVASKRACTLVVVPNQGAATQWLAALASLKPLHIVPPRTTAAQQRLRADLKATATFVTTHSGLLTPLPKLDRIILDLADDEGYFAYDQAPRVDIRYLVAELARLHGARLLVLTRWWSPAVRTLFGQSTPIVLGTLPPVTLVNRQDEPPGERGKLPPSELLERLRTTRTLWLHNRTSEAGRYVCFDCGSPVLCPKCKKPVRVKTQDPLVLECVADNVRIEAPSACAVCKGSRLSTRGPGIQQVARTIADTVRGSTVATLERGTLQGDPQAATHVVATTAIGSYPSLTFAAAVILQADSYFSQPGYRSAEQFFSVLALTRASVSRGGSVYVVTYNPETKAFAFFNSTDAWSQQTLAERAALHYPPAGTLVILQPRKRIATPAEQPLAAASLPLGVSKTVLKNSWLLRTAKDREGELLAWVQQHLDVTWEAVVNPPALPAD